MIENGWYRLRLEATDVNGATSSAEIPIEIGGEAKVGVVRLSFVDLSLPVAGVPIQITRTYDSRVKTKRAFGIGWDLFSTAGSVEHNREPGQGWQIMNNPPPFPLPCAHVDELSSHLTTVRISDRESYTFAPDLINPSTTIGGCLADVHFNFVDGYTPGATLDILGNVGVYQAIGQQDVLDEVTGFPFNPDAFRLTLADGRAIEFRQGVGITAVEDAFGNRADISATGIVSSMGRSVAFTRDSQGRISRITDPSGNTIVYSYDASGDLASVENLVHDVTRFQYSAQFPHLLEHILGPGGDELGSMQFDGSGRMVAECTSSGCTTFEHDIGQRTRRTVDPTGREERIAYDTHGNITSVTDALGNTTTVQYDQGNNPTQLTDPEGNVTTMTYDAYHDLLTQVAPHGAAQNAADFTTTFQYNALRKMTRVTFPAGGQIRASYDSHGELLELRDENNRLLESRSPDQHGNLLSVSNLLGTVSYQYDNFGNAYRVTDTSGNVTTAQFDASGRVTSIVDNGRAATFTMDTAGRTTLVDVGNGVTETYAYGPGKEWIERVTPNNGTIRRDLAPSGANLGWTYPDGTSSSYALDEAGRVLDSIDNETLHTQVTYDAAGRISSITDPSGATQTYTLDRAGRTTRVRDALGHDVVTTYGPDGQITTQTDALGHVWSFASTSSIATATDPLGRHTTNYTTGHGLPLRTVFADGTSNRVEFLGTTEREDAQDYPTRSVDEAGGELHWYYDSNGQLIGATDRANNRFDYTWSHDGLSSIEFPSGETMSFGYDSSGLPASLTYADGTTKTLETGPDGNLAHEVHPSGLAVDFTYDLGGRLTSRVASNGDQATFAYDTTGALASTVDATGVTNYAYNAVHQLSALEQPNGGRISYLRDILGRVTQVAVQATNGAAAQSTTYSYDAASNVTSVLDAAGGTTSFTYDAANRLTTRTLPNGVTTTYGYDLRDRVTSIVHRRANNTVLASFAVTRNVVGAPTLIAREDGSSVSYEYDDALHLTRETQRNTSNAIIRDVTYAYDVDGNRTFRVVNGTAASYAYSAGAKLTAVTGTVSESYSWDTDGRLSGSTRSGATRSYTHDSRDLLTRVAAGSSTTAIATMHYDADGRRVAIEDAHGSRGFVVGQAMGSGLESIHAVTTAAGQVLATYAFVGAQPLARFTASGPVYYLEDPIRSVIAETDASGNLVGRYDFDAFGNPRVVGGGASAIVPSNLGGEFRFHGEWFDGDVGMYHLRARYYDPKTGRFLSRDPRGFDPRRPGTLHPYVFANSAPSLFGDAGGEEFTLIELDLGQSIQANIRSALVNGVRQEIKEQVRKVAGDILVDFIKSVLPFPDIPGAKTVAGLWGTVTSGNVFQHEVNELICGNLQGAWVQWMYLEANLAGNGSPSGGYHCSKRRTNSGSTRGYSYIESVSRGGRKNSVDFLFSKYELDQVAKGSRRTIMPLEVKVSLKTFLSTWGHGGQFPAIRNHVFNYGSYILMGMAFDGGTSAERRSMQAFLGRRRMAAIMVYVFEHG